MVQVSDILIGVLLGLAVWLVLKGCTEGFKEGFGKVLPFFSSAWGESRAPSPQPLGWGAPAGIWSGWPSYAFPYPNNARVPPVPDTSFKNSWKVNSCWHPYEASPWNTGNPKPPRCLVPANAYAGDN